MNAFDEKRQQFNRTGWERRRDRWAAWKKANKGGYMNHGPLLEAAIVKAEGRAQ